MNMTPGTRLGPYEIQTLIGAGGMGEVYRARDVKLGRDVAIKALPDAKSKAYIGGSSTAHSRSGETEVGVLDRSADDIHEQSWLTLA
jgi:serine/threonine protein kinase